MNENVDKSYVTTKRSETVICVLHFHTNRSCVYADVFKSFDLILHGILLSITATIIPNCK